MYHYKIEKTACNENGLMFLIVCQEFPGYLFAYDNVNLSIKEDDAIEVVFTVQVLTLEKVVEERTPEFAAACDDIIRDLMNKILLEAMKEDEANAGQNRS